MDEKPKRGRPPTGEAKEHVSLRLRPVVVAAYKAKGPDWRAAMEKAIVDGLASKDAARAVQVRAVPASPTTWPSGVVIEPQHAVDPGIEAPHVTVAVPLHRPKAFNPQPKKGSAKKR